MFRVLVMFMSTLACVFISHYLHDELVAWRIRQNTIFNGLIQSWCEPCGWYPKQIDDRWYRFITLLLCSRHDPWSKQNCTLLSSNRRIGKRLVPFFTKSCRVGKRRRTAREIDRSSKISINKARRSRTRRKALERSSSPGMYMWMVNINLLQKKKKCSIGNRSYNATPIGLLFILIWPGNGHVSGSKKRLITLVL